MSRFATLLALVTATAASIATSDPAGGPIAEAQLSQMYAFPAGGGEGYAEAAIPIGAHATLAGSDFAVELAFQGPADGTVRLYDPQFAEVAAANVVGGQATLLTLEDPFAVCTTVVDGQCVIELIWILDSTAPVTVNATYELRAQADVNASAPALGFWVY